jgi:AraC family transcriptional regulator, transcriptional activator of the genes for pyochelin and ferripyochelin receptors
MSIVLRDEQYEARFAEQLAQGLAYEECITETNQEKRYHYGSSVLFRGGCDRFFHLRDGLDLRICRFEPTADPLITDIEADDSKLLSLSFFVTGDMYTNRQGGFEGEEAAGGSYLMSYPGVPETEGWQSQQQILRVKVNIDPTVFLARMGTEQLASLLPILQALASGQSAEPFYRQGVITPEIRTILRQVLHCPYEGTMKQWYLEAKTLELMTLQFDQLGCKSAQEARLKSPDIDRIHRAQELLLQNLEHPPSLLELAHWVETNDCTLKRGFKQVFGTTVFGYLRQQRLQVARQLLATTSLKVQTVGRKVGFCDRNHFTRIFKQKFGMTPTEYRQQQHNIPSSPAGNSAWPCRLSQTTG